MCLNERLHDMTLGGHERSGREVFSIIKVIQTNADDIWVVGGRAYENITIGDEVLSMSITDTGEEIVCAFTVERIETYRHVVPQLPSGLTGTLWLHGKGGRSLKQDGMLRIASVHLLARQFRGQI